MIITTQVCDLCGAPEAPKTRSASVACHGGDGGAIAIQLEANKMPRCLHACKACLGQAVDKLLPPGTPLRRAFDERAPQEDHQLVGGFSS